MHQFILDGKPIEDGFSKCERVDHMTTEIDFSVHWYGLIDSK